MNKEQLLRYAELIFKREELAKRSEELPSNELAEVERLRSDLRMSHEEIMVAAAKEIANGK